MKIIAPLLTTIVFSVVFFGGFARFFVGYLFLWNDRLGAPGWPLFLIASTVCATVVACHLSRSGCGPAAINSIVLGVFLVLSVLLVGTYAEISRRLILIEFDADREFQNLIWMSLHNAPTEWQFFIHAGAMKDCIPYAWSYRNMNMYELSDRVMFNVLPYEWFDECDMKPKNKD